MKAYHIEKIFHSYKIALAQMVNEDKSELFFSKIVQSSIKSHISQHLGIKEVKKFNKYLGLPTVTSISKRELFDEVKARLSK